MNADATITETMVYLIEFSDDGNHPEQPDPEIVIIPPVSQGTGPSSTPGAAPAPPPQL